MTKRNPKLAALLSVIPGLGQFYNKRPIKGTIFFIFFISFISVFYSFLNIGFWGLFTLGTVPEVRRFSCLTCTRYYFYLTRCFRNHAIYH